MDEFQYAKKLLDSLLKKHYTDTGSKAKKIFISDQQELQSLMMWYADAWGVPFERTTKEKSYCE